MLAYRRSSWRLPSVALARLCRPLQRRRLCRRGVPPPAAPAPSPPAAAPTAIPFTTAAPRSALSISARQAVPDGEAASRAHGEGRRMPPPQRRALSVTGHTDSAEARSEAPRPVAAARRSVAAGLVAAGVHAIASISTAAAERTRRGDGGRRARAAKPTRRDRHPSDTGGGRTDKRGRDRGPVHPVPVGAGYAWRHPARPAPNS